MTEDHVIAVMGLDPRARAAHARAIGESLGVTVRHVEIGCGLPTEDVLQGAYVGGVAVLDVSEEALATEIIGASVEANVPLSAIVAVVDGDALEPVFASDASLVRVHDGEDETFEIPLSVLLTSHLEYATCIVLKHPTHRREGLVRALNPDADLECIGDGEVCAPRLRLRDPQDGLPGWLQVVNGVVHDDATRVVHYVRARPFHPGRLHDLLESECAWGSLIRVAGFTRLASRPGVLSLWEQSGVTVSVDPYEADWWATESDGDRAGCEAPAPDQVGMEVLGQDLVAIGADLDVQAFVSDLDSCLLSDEEFLDGVWAWVCYEDSFPA